MPSRLSPRWAGHDSPWKASWDAVIEHNEWFDLYPDAPPFDTATELRFRVLRRRPRDVPHVLWNAAAREPLLASPLARLMDAGPAALRARMNSITVADVRAALADCSGDRAPVRKTSPALALLSPAADALREELGREAQERTERRFQRRMRLFAPLYLSSFCHNRCSYCHFSIDNPEPRTALDPSEIERELRALSERGLSEVLLLSGESKLAFDVNQLAHATSMACEHFSSVRLEVFPLATSDYAKLRSAGAAGVTLYQETYDPELYRQVHRAGRKRDLLFRLGALERAATAGFQELGIGALLGLGDWRYEGVAMALHAEALQRSFPNARVALSVPRIRCGPNGFLPARPVADEELEHLLAVMRLTLPDSDLVLSTREPPALRDRLSRRFLTRLSAESITRPGGYAETRTDLAEQFETHDQRSAREIRASLRADGFDVC